MSRMYRLAILVPAVMALMNVAFAALAAAEGPCPYIGC